MKKWYFITIVIISTSCSKIDDGTPSGIDAELEGLLAKASNQQGKSFYVFPEASQISAIPQDPKNPLSAEKIELGSFLFHETALGRSPIHAESFQTYSCASCHHVKAGFQACVPQGMGDGGLGFGVQGETRKKNAAYADSEVDVQPVRSPSALNAAYQTNMLWNGQFGATHINTGTQASWTAGTPKAKNHLGFQGVETQAIAGQDVHRLFISKVFIEQYPGYATRFKKAFPTMDLGDNASLKINAGLAIAAYERTLLASEAPFQKWLKGNTKAMTNQQKQGAVLFFGKANCVTCHNGPSLANMEFYGLGMSDLQNGSYGANLVQNVNAAAPDHKGRGGFTGVAADMFKFKVPQLYNLKDSPFYGHGASFRSINAIIKYKNEAQKQNSNVPDTQLAKEFVPLHLSALEIQQLTDFIENGLYDNNLKRYLPKALPSGLAFPNNDAQSRKDLGLPN